MCIIPIYTTPFIALDTGVGWSLKVASRCRSTFQRSFCRHREATGQYIEVAVAKLLQFSSTRRVKACGRGWRQQRQRRKRGWCGERVLIHTSELFLGSIELLCLQTLFCFKCLHLCQRRRVVAPAVVQREYGHLFIVQDLFLSQNKTN
jgi:hypothetical protein